MNLYAYLVAMLIGIGIGGGTAWKVQGNRYEHVISGMVVDAAKKEADAKDALVKASETARLAEQALSTKYQGALDEAAKREIALRNSLVASRSAERGLRDTIARTRADLPGYTQPAAVAVAATAADLLGICSAELVRVAEAADRGYSEALTLRAAWPKAVAPPPK